MPEANNDLDKKVVQISGPVNVVRLEGNIHGVRKIIYLFMDFHIPVYIQTECTNIFSKDINKYFAESFYELNNTSKKYDFFMEVRPNDIIRMGTEQAKKRKQIYIDQMVKLFAIILKYDKEKNKISISDYFKNVRIHYLDVRDYLQLHISNVYNEALDISSRFMTYGISAHGLMAINDILTKEKQMLDITIQIFMDTSYKLPADKKPHIRESNFSYYTSEIEPDIVINLLNKIKNRYNHKDIQKIINDIFDNLMEELKKLSDDIGLVIEKFEDYIKILSINNPNTLIKDEKTGEYNYGFTGYKLRSMTFDTINKCEELHATTMEIFYKLTDLYLLRRFLDKDYVTNGIVFSGAAHSLNYIAILLGYFNFKITHVAYAPIGNINDLNKETKKRISKNENIEDLFYPPELYQCSDITHFPKNFE